MSKTVKPLNISLLIRGSRYILLFSGITYGILRQSAIKVYEATARGKRDQMYLEEEKRIKLQIMKKSKAELQLLTSQLNISEIPAGWENDVDI